MAELLPPRYANIPVALLYEVDLPTSVRLTALRIYGLGWRHRYERTDPITLAELMEICEVGRSTLYGHLATLSDKRVLRYTTVSVGSSRTFVFELAIGTADRPENWTDSAVVAAAVPSSSPSSPNPHEQQQHTHAVQRESEGDSGASRNLDTLSSILETLGIREPTRSRLLKLPHVTVPYLEAWHDWFHAQDTLGIGWVITQLQAHQQPPAPPAKADGEWRRPPDSQGYYRRYVNT